MTLTRRTALMVGAAGLLSAVAVGPPATDVALLEPDAPAGATKDGLRGERAE